jgi:hypothetical protein
MAFLGYLISIFNRVKRSSAADATILSFIKSAAFDSCEILIPRIFI